MNKLWVDDIRRPPDDTWLWARTNDEAKEIFEEHYILECSLDHDMGLHDFDPDEQDADLRVSPKHWEYECGEDLVKWMILKGFIPPQITIHSWNPIGAQRMADLFHDYDPYLAVHVEPFDTSIRNEIK